MLKPTSIIRKLNDDGIIVIPKVIRDRLNLHKDDILEIYFDSEENMIGFKKISKDS